jgi:hypothetical protein
MTKLVKQQNSVGVVKVNLSELKNISKNDVVLYNSNLNSKKFKDYSTEKDLLLMNALITKWAKYIGAKIPEPIDMNGLANFFKESFPNFNDFDLNECIILLVNGKLDTDAESYGSLSPMYCSKVLHAYQEHKSRILFKVRDEIQKIESQQPKAIDKNQRLLDFKKLLSYAKKDVEDKKTFIDTGDVIYNFIRYNKLIKIPKELQEEALSYGEKMFSDEKKKKVIEATMKNHAYKTTADLNFEKEDKVKKYAREFVVNKWLEQTEMDKIVQKITYEMIDIK